MYELEPAGHTCPGTPTKSGLKQPEGQAPPVNGVSRRAVPGEAGGGVPQTWTPSSSNTEGAPGGKSWVRPLGQEDALEEAWRPTPVFLPGAPHGQRSLAAVVHGVVKSKTRLSD